MSASRDAAGTRGPSARVTTALSPATGPACPVPIAHDDRIVLGHGGGGRLTTELIENLFRPIFDDPTLRDADDSAVLSAGVLAGAGEIAISTDAHVVRPLFFPGGDIGRLSICGTVNDLAMVGARPLWITVAFIIEEGFRMEDLRRIATSMRAAADEAGIAIVAGDTKVAERGNVDGVYITTTGVGVVPAERTAARAAAIQPGDAVLVSGPLGDHGIAVLAARGDLALQAEIASDTAPLNHLVEAMYATGGAIRALRDPTRGGLAAALNEMAGASGVGVVLEEARLPVRQEVAAACEILGFDPLHIANEGKLVAFVAADDADAILATMRSVPRGADACQIGRVETTPRGRVVLETEIGGTRIVDMPAGELLPRIC